MPRAWRDFDEPLTSFYLQVETVTRIGILCYCPRIGRCMSSICTLFNACDLDLHLPRMSHGHVAVIIRPVHCGGDQTDIALVSCGVAEPVAPKRLNPQTESPM
jgi:hypothetical protein